MVTGVGRVLRDRYRFDRELGQRGHVVTWLVTDLRSASPCVLKILREADAPPADARLFEAQARIISGLDYPGLPRFVENFVEGEGAQREHIFITRYHPGESLRRLVGKGRLLTELQAVALLRRLVPILAYLHGFSPPLVHRGIKASNIIVGPDGRPCLTDLHFAVSGDGWKAWEETPPSADELALEAPEVVLNEPVPASDIYAVGLALVYGMSGQDPAALAREGNRQRIREVTSASEGFGAVLARMVELPLDRRYPDVQALEADLARLAAGRGPAPVAAATVGASKATAPSPSQPATRQPDAPAPVLAGPAQPRRGGPLRIAILLVVLAVVGALAWWNTPRGTEQAGESLMPPSAPSRSEAPAPAPPVPPPPVPAPAPEPAPAPAPAESPAQPAAAPAVPAGPVAPAAPAPSQPAAAGAGAESPATPAPAAAPAAAGPGVVEGKLLFDGQPITRVTRLEPTFWFRNEKKGAPEKPQVEYGDGAFRVRGLPAGKMGMSMRINLEPGNPNLYPGDLDAWTTFTVGEAATAPLEINMRKVIHLKQPVDNGVVIRGWDEACGAGNVLPGKAVFSWEPLDPAATYDVTVDKLACGRNYAPAGRVFAKSIAESWVKLELPPSAAGECYSFRLTARKSERPIGMFTTHGRDGLGWDFRFTVK